MKKLTTEETKAYIGKLVDIKMDQPLGSKHSGHPETIQYPINYGFVPGTLAEDGEELDAYLLGVNVPLEKYTGRCIAIIHRTNDDDDKLVIVPDGMSFSDEEIVSQTYFQERFFESVIWR